MVGYTQNGRVYIVQNGRVYIVQNGRVYIVQNGRVYIVLQRLWSPLAECCSICEAVSAKWFCLNCTVAA